MTSGKKLLCVYVCVQCLCHLVLSDVLAGAGRVQQGAECLQAGHDVLYGLLRTGETQELNADACSMEDDPQTPQTRR